MARGKIVFTPCVSRAVILPGDAYLSLEDESFNAGTGDFHVDAVLKVETDTPYREVLVAGKGNPHQSGGVGWQVFVDRDLTALGLRINDGQENPAVYLSDPDLFTLGEWFWASWALDRDGDPQIRFNGGLCGDGYLGYGEAGYGDYGYGGSPPPADYGGSLDNSLPLVAGQNAKISLAHLRVGLGQVWPDAWISREWCRLRYGLSPEVYDFLALWLFNDSLADLSGTRTWSWEGEGAAAYGDGWPYAAAPLTYEFEHNFEFGHEFGYLPDLEFIERAADGTAYSYRQGYKRFFSLTFPFVSQDQQAFFQALWASGVAFKFFEDAARPDYITAILAGPPAPASVFHGMHHVEVEIQEV